MFHHFHGNKHLPSQGSLSSKDFSNMLDWLGRNYKLIGAREYLERFESFQIEADHICLSFDDALLSQYDIAVPILKERNLDAFFFIYSSIYTSKPDNLEIFRYFRCHNFDTIDEFYKHFFAIVKKKFDNDLLHHQKEYENKNYLSTSKYYSENDKWFRYLRDQVLGPEHYEKIMIKMIDESEFDPQEILSDIWISEDHLKEIASHGHLVGLHSFNHPTQMSKLNYYEQFEEYQKNYQHLKGIVGDIVSMSHPCGNYNDDTLKILDEMGIQIGFRSNVNIVQIKSKFEVPRENHINVFKKINK